MTGDNRIHVCQQCQLEVLQGNSTRCPFCALDATLAERRGWKHVSRWVGWTDRYQQYWASSKDWDATLYYPLSLYHPTRSLQQALELLSWVSIQGADFECRMIGDKHSCVIYYQSSTFGEAAVNYPFAICKAIAAAGVVVAGVKQKREDATVCNSFTIKAEPYWAAEEESRSAAFPENEEE